MWEEGELASLIALVLAGGIFPAAAGSSPITTPLQLKQDSLTALEEVSVDDRWLARVVDRANHEISRGIWDRRGEPLFLDDTRIVPPSRGGQAFAHDKRAVAHLGKGLARGNISDNVKDVFQQVVDNLLEADGKIASLSLEVAERLTEAGEGDARKLPKARLAFEAALAEADPGKAIKGFEKSWRISQDVVDGKGIQIASFWDAPDPFIPSEAINTLAVNFQVSMRRSFHAGRGGDYGVVELHEVIQDSAGNIVRTLVHERELSPGSPLAHDIAFGTLEVEVESTWDGENDEGQVVAEGTYSYLAFGKLKRVLTNRGDNRRKGRDENGDNLEAPGVGGEKILAVSFPIVGEIYVDGGPPAPPEVTSVEAGADQITIAGNVDQDVVEVVAACDDNCSVTSSLVFDEATFEVLVGPKDPHNPFAGDIEVQLVTQDVAGNLSTDAPGVGPVTVVSRFDVSVGTVLVGVEPAPGFLHFNPGHTIIEGGNPAPVGGQLVNFKIASSLRWETDDIKVIVFAQISPGVFTATQSQSIVSSVAANTAAVFALDPPLPINAGEFLGAFYSTGAAARDGAGPAGFLLSGDQSTAVDLAFASTAPAGQIQIGGDIAP